MKILYVEDNPVNLSLIQRIAQMNKHELVSYDEAEKALVALEEGLTVDLILLDIQLAGEMDGIGFAKTIRQRNYNQPIIAITAYAMMGDKERILAAGCNEYLPKPLPIAEFLTLLAKYDPALNPGASPAPSPAPAAPPPSSEAAPAPSTTEASPAAAPAPTAEASTPAPSPEAAAPAMASTPSPEAAAPVKEATAAPSPNAETPAPASESTPPPA
jgi:CheY-like chemotaxis protein